MSSMRVRIWRRQAQKSESLSNHEAYLLIEPQKLCSPVVNLPHSALARVGKDGLCADEAFCKL